MNPDKERLCRDIEKTVSRLQVLVNSARNLRGADTSRLTCAWRNVQAATQLIYQTIEDAHHG